MSLLSALTRWKRRDEDGLREPDEAMWRRAESRLPFLAFLPADDGPRLRSLALRFLAEKEFSGAHGFELDDEVLLGIALQACLPVLNLGLEWYRGWVGIVVYPGDFVIPRRIMDEHGVVHEYDEPAAGEAWDGGPVLVGWQPERDRGDGMNVVIHEFAHKLDMINDAVDGMPPLHADMSRTAWTKSFSAAYKDFCGFVDHGGDPWLDPYAAESPSEFFAVASEAFFEMPLLLREDMPEVYEQLRLFYRQDPARGAEGAASAGAGA